MKMSLGVQWILERLMERGLNPYIVGGAVRDHFLGLPAQDIDVAIKGSESLLEELKKEFEVSGEVGLRYGSLTINVNDEGIRHLEITLFRKEGSYFDARHPQTVHFQASLDEDLFRRDFTLNALAYEVRTSRIIDLYGALEDLKQDVVTIKTCQEADQSFSQDALRVVRAFRLYGRVALVKKVVFSEEIKQAIQRYGRNIASLSKQVVHRELRKIWESPNTGDVFMAMQEYGLLPFLFPSIEGSNRFSNNLSVLDVDKPLSEKMSMLSFLMGISPVVLFAELGYPRSSIKKAKQYYLGLMALADDDAVHGKTSLQAFSAEEKKVCCQLCQDISVKNFALYVRICEKHEVTSVQDLDIGPNDLMALGVQQADISRVLQQLLQAVYRDEAVNRKEILKQLFHKKVGTNGQYES